MQHTHLCVHSICHKLILLTTSSALSFIFYACTNILLGGMVTDILGYLGHTVFVANCKYVAKIWLYITIFVLLMYSFLASAGSWAGSLYIAMWDGTYKHQLARILK